MDTTTSEQVCPYCMMPLLPSQKILHCPQCNTAHHRTCWQDNKGCTQSDCKGQIQERTQPQEVLIIKPITKAFRQTAIISGILLGLIELIFQLVLYHGISSYNDSYRSLTGYSIPVEIPGMVILAMLHSTCVVVISCFIYYYPLPSGIILIILGFLSIYITSPIFCLLLISVGILSIVGFRERKNEINAKTTDANITVKQLTDDFDYCDRCGIYVDTLFRITHKGMCNDCYYIYKQSRKVH